MRTVKTKKELIKAIEDGEKHIKIESVKLYAACELAEEYNSASQIMKHYVFSKVFSKIGHTMTFNAIDGGVVAIVITISICVTAVAIIGILNDKKVKIKCNWNGKGGTIEIY